MYSLAVGACASAAIGQLFSISIGFSDTGPHHQRNPVRFHCDHHPATRASQFNPGTSRGAAASSATSARSWQFPTQRTPPWPPGEQTPCGAARRTRKQRRRNHHRQGTVGCRPTRARTRQTPRPTNATTTPTSDLTHHHLPHRYGRIATRHCSASWAVRGLKSDSSASVSVSGAIVFIG
jgi:hypothetical protein